MYAGSKRLAPSFWSVGISVDRCIDSPDLHHCGRSSGKSQCRSGPKQRIPCGYSGSLHVTCSVSLTIHSFYFLTLATFILFLSYPTVLHLFLQKFKITFNHFTYVCSSRARNITLGILYGYKLVVHLIILAFTSLKVKVKGLDDAKYITASISMISTMLAIMLLTTYFLNEYVNWFPGLFSTALFISTTFILALVFVPKVWDCVGPSK